MKAKPKAHGAPSIEIQLNDLRIEFLPYLRSADGYRMVRVHGPKGSYETFIPIEGGFRPDHDSLSAAAIWIAAENIEPAMAGKKSAVPREKRNQKCRDLWLTYQEFIDDWFRGHPPGKPPSEGGWSYNQAKEEAAKHFDVSKSTITNHKSQITRKTRPKSKKTR